MAVYGLEEGKIYFPKPELAEPDGLLAVGGDLSVERLLLAYSNGIFPWYDSDQPILWWCPHERYIIRPENIHISHSMRKFMRKHDVTFTLDRDFADTMHRCRIKREFTVGTWITDDMEKAYLELHRAGYATSVEGYIDGELAGGLYGVNIGKCFFGESMFSEMENGSKTALIALAGVLQKLGYLMIDCQFETEHLKSMGGEAISYADYKTILDEGIEKTLL
jgi:leucyl/phenylalanyl-tRNA--protein transferase